MLIHTIFFQYFLANASPAETESFKFLNPSKLFDVIKSKIAENIVGTAKNVVTLNSFNNDRNYFWRWSFRK